MRVFTYIFWILVILVGISFAAINSRSVEIHYYIGKVSIYLPLLLFFALVLGAILGVIAMLPQYLKAKSVARKLRSKLKQLEIETQKSSTVTNEGFGE